LLACMEPAWVRSLAIALMLTRAWADSLSRKASLIFWMCGLNHSDGSCLWNHLGSADSPVVELDGDGILYGLLSVGGAYTPTSAETVLAKVKVSVE
jgi:hypothetical protein